jgi:hypothetical protein
VLSWGADSRAEWEPVVARMRQMASSGITKADGEIVLRCLEQRATGPAVGSREPSR